MSALIGTAGWAIKKLHAAAFPQAGSHLERYAAVFAAVEINSTFHRPHRASTFTRWAASVPPSFRFSVKLPKAITHELRLVEALAPTDAFLEQVRCLGDRLGCLLVQLPPSLEWNAAIATAFFDALRERHAGDIALEPRHASWFTREPGQMLIERRIACVAADPPHGCLTVEPGGWDGLAYFRLHGSPRMYYSDYDRAALAELAARMQALANSAKPCWCIFDNTALGAATPNALALQEMLRVGPA
jgi:uncharacterized protein YecE (DUF72 family)